MDSRKRKIGRPAFERRVRQKPAEFVDDDESGPDEYDAAEPGIRGGDDRESESASGSEAEEEDGASESGDEEADEEEEDDAAPPSPSGDLTFGQILKRQRKAATGKTAAKGRPSSATAASRKSTADAASSAKERSEERPSASASASASASKTRKPSRAHKHAPTEVSSRFAVKRGHDWSSGDATIAGVTVKSVEARSRDPRFFLASVAAQPPSRRDEVRARRNYAFLDEYRDKEMSQMREELARVERAAKAQRKKAGRRNAGNAGNAAKTEAAEQEVAALRRQLESMEARKRDREAKEKAQSVLDEHQKRERELVRQGKTPYFLKKSEQKKRLLVDRFAGMTDQQVEKAIERRRKKTVSRERREMPLPRQGGA